MLFKQIPPPPALRTYVRYFWTLESACNVATPQKFGPLADGFPGIIFQPHAQGVFFDRDHNKLPEVFLYGQTVTHTALYLVGQFNTTGISFEPNALKTIFKFDANELTDGCLSIHDMSIGKEKSINDQLLNTQKPERQFEILSDFLISHLRTTSTQADPLTKIALEKIIQSKGRIGLPELQQSLGVSERTFERKFNQHVGVSPKIYTSICKFQSALLQIKNSDEAKLSDIAFDSGYADQSHFIRSFQKFAGISPLQFQKQSLLLDDEFRLTVR